MPKRRVLLGAGIAALVLVLVAGLLVVGVVVWQRLNRSDLEKALTLLAREFHARTATTTSFASLVSAEPDRLVAQIETLVPLVKRGVFAGIHLEGPFLSAAKCGAHDPALLRPPAPELLDRLLAAGEDRIAMITIAPELEHGLAATERLTRAGVRVAFGHSDADERQTGEAIDAGAEVATHLYNAMRSIHHREPGPIPRLLTARVDHGRADLRRHPPAPGRDHDGDRRGRAGPGGVDHRRDERGRAGRRVVPARSSWTWSSSRAPSTWSTPTARSARSPAPP